MKIIFISNEGNDLTHPFQLILITANKDRGKRKRKTSTERKSLERTRKDVRNKREKSLKSKRIKERKTKIIRTEMKLEWMKGKRETKGKKEG